MTLDEAWISTADPSDLFDAALNKDLPAETRAAVRRRLGRLRLGHEPLPKVKKKKRR